MKNTVFTRCFVSVRCLTQRQETCSAEMEIKMIDWKKAALFAGGTLFGTAGIKILASEDAKKIYTNCTAAVLRAKDCVMKTVNDIQENAGDIIADAKIINEERAVKKEAAEYDDAEETMEEETVTA